MPRMPRLSLPMLSTAAVVAIAGTAIAAELTAAELKEMLVGKTVYTSFNATSLGGAGEGVIYYDPAGTALYRTAKGEKWHGTWTLKDNTVCVDWKEMPNNPCSKYDKQGDKIVNINVKTGQARGTIAKTAAGNAEKLTP